MALDLTIPLYLPALIFACVAFFYASVGLGGGSSYTALLAIFGASTAVIPMVSLTINLLVTTFGSLAFMLRGHARWRLIAPFVITSVPMAYLGGMLHLPKLVFYFLLAVSLGIAAARIYFPGRYKPLQIDHKYRLLTALGCGAVLGLVAGITGIGGGIYLVPLIILLGLGTTREAAASGAFFIWVNSLSGLLARLQFNSIELAPYLPLVIAAVVGGMAGTMMGVGRFQQPTMQKILGSILIIAILLLGKKMVELII
jgi:hypothetical protein